MSESLASVRECPVLSWFLGATIGSLAAAPALAFEDVSLAVWVGVVASVVGGILGFGLSRMNHGYCEEAPQNAISLCLLYLLSPFAAFVALWLPLGGIARGGTPGAVLGFGIALPVGVKCYLHAKLHHAGGSLPGRAATVALVCTDIFGVIFVFLAALLFVLTLK